jgi:hypothetical protein
MIRRNFLRLIGLLGLGSVAIFSIDTSFIRRIIYKIEGLFKAPVKLPPDSEREKADLPSEGYAISVEMALNSRCTSDYDGNPKKFHWGLFDKTKKLSDEQIENIVQLSKVPRFTDLRLEIQTKQNILTFVVDNRALGIQRDWVMVESGMQQQAVGLVCAALGVGMVFRNQGKDGTALSNTDCATVKFRLDAMKPTYGGSFWCSLPPADLKPRKKGNLPDPVRDSNKPLISTLEELKVKSDTGETATDKAMSQLLWAARGRTPHYYKSRPWGLTIPTWAGEQNISTVFVVSKHGLSKYSNWGRFRPTHALQQVKKVDEALLQQLLSLFSANHGLIILAKNEDFARALWEVGYQLLNLVLQATSLNISYQAVLLDETQRATVGRTGLKDPVAILAI